MGRRQEEARREDSAAKAELEAEAKAAAAAAAQSPRPTLFDDQAEEEALRERLDRLGKANAEVFNRNFDRWP